MTTTDAPNRVVLAEYFTSEDLTLLFIVRQDFDEPHVVPLEISLSELRAAVATSFRSSAAIRRQTPEQTEKWNACLVPLVEPLLDWTEPGDIIWFVPHDILHYVPLHAVRINGRYLIERNPVCSTPSASVMKYCQARRRPRSGRALVVGDSLGDLEHARAEARTVAALFGTSPIIGRQASKSRLLRELSSLEQPLDVLHLACHGKLDRDQPLKSGILLAPESESAASGTPVGRERLTAEEIFQLEIDAGLVTLSACETGINDRKPGDELIGLTRSLIYAGTPSVLVSLWEVDDLSTRLLMERFYEFLGSASTSSEPQMNKAQALQRAQCELLRMTADELRAWSEKRLAREAVGDNPIELVQAKIDQATTAALCGEISTARAMIDDELTHLSRTSDTELRVRLRRLQRKLSGSPEEQAVSESDPAYPFPHIYHWAAFSLIGDWR